MRSFRVREEVATTARNAPCKSSFVKARKSSSIFPARAHSRTAGLASRATTRMRAPVSSRPLIFGSPTFPAPTTRHCRASSFMNIGNKLVTNTSCHLNKILRGGQIARDRRNAFSGKELAQLRVAMTREEASQVFARLAFGEIPAEQPFQSVRDIRSETAISDRPRRRLMQTERSAYAEVVSIGQLIA